MRYMSDGKSAVSVTKFDLIHNLMDLPVKHVHCFLPAHSFLFARSFPFPHLSFLFPNQIFLIPHEPCQSPKHLLSANKTHQKHKLKPPPPPPTSKLAQFSSQPHHHSTKPPSPSQAQQKAPCARQPTTDPSQAHPSSSPPHPHRPSPVQPGSLHKTRSPPVHRLPMPSPTRDLADGLYSAARSSVAGRSTARKSR